MSNKCSRRLPQVRMSSIELRASASASRRSPLAARLDVRNDDLSAPAWIDFLSAEIVGYCCRPEERPLFKTSNDNEAAPSPAAAEIAQSNAHCFIASSPHVATAGLALHPGQTRSFLVRCEALPPTLPPSFDGSALCCEYVLLVSARRRSSTLSKPLGSERGKGGRLARRAA